MKLTAKEREAIEKAEDWWFGNKRTAQEIRVRRGGRYTRTLEAYALGYLAGQRDAKKGKGKK